MDHKHDLGIPDWRDADAYPDPKRTSDRQWWWEFLRRRDDYRDEWRATYDEAQARFDAMLAAGDCGMDVEHRERLRCFGLYKLEYRERFKIWSPMLTPAMPRPTRDFSPRRPGAYHVSYRDFEAAQAAWERGEYQIAFDLRKPLGPQLALAKDVLTALQRETAGRAVDARHHKAKWSLYLRVLDARDQGATFQDIGTRLFGVGKSNLGESDLAAKAFQGHAQARELMFRATS